MNNRVKMQSEHIRVHRSPPSLTPSRQCRSSPSNSCSSEARQKESSFSSPPPSPPPPPESFFAFATSSSRSFRNRSVRASFAERSKYFFPSIQVCTQTVSHASGDFDQIAKS